ncbi:hypothetical protein SBBP2_1590006 [Burkholderiales bacterium]|nr:hypothetical protein SBBP2_1590006 [Burkholderiales bacterium]
MYGGPCIRQTLLTGLGMRGSAYESADCGLRVALEKTAEYRRKIGHIPHQGEESNARRAPKA